MTAIKKHFIIDSFSNVIYFGCKFLFNILIYALLINAFSLKEYGVYIFFASLMGQIEFMQSGFSISLERYVPLSKETKNITNLVGLVAFVYFVFGILFSVGLIVLSYFDFFDLFGFEVWKNYVTILIFFAPFIWLFKSFSFALKGSKDYRIENLINIFSLFIELVVVYGMIQFGDGLEKIFTFVLALLLVRHFSHFIAFLIRHRFNPKLLTIQAITTQFHTIKRFSLWNFISTFSSNLMNQFDKTLVAFYFGATALPVYYGLSQILKFYSLSLGVLNSSVIPYFSKKISVSDNNTFNNIATKGTLITTFVGMTLAGFLVLYSNLIFTLISKDYLLSFITTFNVGIILYGIVGSRSFLNKLHLCKSIHVKNLSIFGLLTALLYPIVFWGSSSVFDLSGAILSPIVSHLLIFPFWVHYFFKKTNLKLWSYFRTLLENAFQTFSVFLPVYFFNAFLLKNELTLVISLLESILIVGILYLIGRKKIVVPLIKILNH